MAISIAELSATGIQFEADEAVAITQQLIDVLRDPYAYSQVEPPYGPPSAETVSLKRDGTVVCHGCGTTPTVSEVGIFLHSLLRAGSPRVPGGLRYAIARALLDVDVPPFDSLDDFSRDLARHEHGERTKVVRRLLRRAGGQPAALAVTAFDRRRRQPPATELRRALREADARLYEYQHNHEVLDVKPVPPRLRTSTATTACLAAGLALICTGELMHRRSEPTMVAPPAPPAPLAAQSIAPDPPAATLERGIISVRDVPSTSAVAAQAEVQRVSVKRTPKRPPAITVRRATTSSRPQSRGVLDRLRLGWLRNAFGARSAL